MTPGGFYTLKYNSVTIISLSYSVLKEEWS